jgi:hypothetical protein
MASQTWDEANKAEPNTTLPGDGKAFPTKTNDNEYGYCNNRVAGIMVPPTGIAANGVMPKWATKDSMGLAYERGRELGRVKGPYRAR